MPYKIYPYQNAKYLKKTTKFCSKYPKVHLYQKLAQMDHFPMPDTFSVENKNKKSSRKI